jgi:uncharacterized protein YutE (UPF0331/DUF86 family)
VPRATPDEAVALNEANAVERGVDQLDNHIAELTAFGLELAVARRRGDDLDARRDLVALRRLGVIAPERARRLERLRELRRLGVIAPERARRLERLRELRRLLVHLYATATAEQVHEAARIVSDEFVPFHDAYRAWTARGFSASPR